MKISFCSVENEHSVKHKWDIIGLTHVMHMLGLLSEMHNMLKGQRAWSESKNIGWPNKGDHVKRETQDEGDDKTVKSIYGDNCNSPTLIMYIYLIKTYLFI